MDTYIVESFDTVESIARKFGLPVIEIVRANNLKAPYILTVGESLMIPTTLYNVFDYYVVKKGDTLYSIANSNNTTVDIISSVNGLNKDEYIYENQTVLIPKSDVDLYITKTGDTVETLSKYFNTSSAEVIYSNNSIYLLPGQLIIYRKA